MESAGLRVGYRVPTFKDQDYENVEQNLENRTGLSGRLPKVVVVANNQRRSGRYFGVADHRGLKCPPPYYSLRDRQIPSHPPLIPAHPDSMQALLVGPEI